MNTKPKRLEKGMTIGVVSPASPSFYRSDIQRGIESLESWGYKAVPGKHLSKRYEYLAGTDGERAEDMNEMFSRKDIDAVFVTQGGYGSARILRYLDFDTIQNNPKIFVGFSDITSLHLAIRKVTGLVTFHGPGMSRFNSEELTRYTEDHLFMAVSSSEAIGKIAPADEKKYIHIIHGGKARGEITGGNLTLICATLGTPYEIDTAGRILFFEEIETEPWIIDHMLTHLMNAGKLQDAAGIIVGECKNCEPFKHNPGFPVTFSLEDVLEDFLAPLGVPVICGLPLGHTRDLATIPIGVQAFLDADEGALFIEECATV